MKKILVLLISLLIVVDIVFFFYYSNLSKDEIYRAEINSEVEQLLENQTALRVIVFVNSTTDGDLELTKQQILSKLLESEFKLAHNLNYTDWFSGEITKKGLEKLRSNKDVLRIEKEKSGGLDENSSEKIVSYPESKMFSIGGREFKSYGNLSVELIILKSFFEDSFYKMDVSIWLNDSEDPKLNDIRRENIKKFLGNDFEVNWYIEGDSKMAGILTKEGLIKLREYNASLIIAEITTGDTKIDNPHIDYAIYDELSHSEYVSVAITIKTNNDTTMNDILIGFSPSEFKLKETYSRIISGEITWKGLDKISNNSYIETIALNRIYNGYV